MKNSFLKINLLNAFFIIILLFIYLISYSNTGNINSVNLKNIRKLENNGKNDENDYIELLYKCEELRQKNKKLEEDIFLLEKKNQDYNLKIEVNKIYINILYIIIFIFLLAIIIIIIIKFYSQCQKRPKNIRHFILKENKEQETLERNNEIHN